MTTPSILHRFPLEIRELIYSYVLSDVHDFQYDIGTKPEALEDMKEFERALIPDRQLYREVVSHRIRQSCLVLEPEWPEEPPRFAIVSWEIDADVPLLYPSVEDMSPLARENIRRIEVKVPGYPISPGVWELSPCDLEYGYYRFRNLSKRILSVSSLASTIFMPLLHARNVQSIVIKFAHALQHDESRTEGIKTLKDWSAFAHLLSSIDFGSYLSCFKRLNYFELRGHHGVFPELPYMPDVRNICRCGIPDVGACQRCYNLSDIWKAFDECFGPVRARSSFDAAVFQRSWRVWYGEILCWHRKKKGFLEWK